MGMALAKMGKTGEAIGELKSALELDSTLDAAKAEMKRLK